MSDPLRKSPPGFDDLTVEQQIDYLQLLWDRIAATPDRVAEPGWHHSVLDERLRAHRESPGEFTSWEDVRERVARRIGDRSQ